MLLPFGSNVILFSNVMALNIVPSMNNDEDYLQKYKKFYKDENFREAYYNYHKQHHQHNQQQQQQQQIEKEVQLNIGQEKQQNSMTESLPQQNKQQQGQQSSISQEQMHQQQIVKLKQLLEAVR
jgi:hypothetical protein